MLKLSDPSLQWARDLYERVKHTRPDKLPSAWDDMSSIERACFLGRWRAEQGIVPRAKTVGESLAMAGFVEIPIEKRRVERRMAVVE